MSVMSVVELGAEQVEEQEEEARLFDLDFEPECDVKHPGCGGTATWSAQCRSCHTTALFCDLCRQMFLSNWRDLQLRLFVTRGLLVQPQCATCKTKFLTVEDALIWARVKS